MKTTTINLYSFSELCEKSKQKAVENHREFELSIMRETDFISGIEEYDTPDELKKAFDAEYDYYLMNDEPIIEAIEANGYLFFSNGELANCITYTGAHAKSGNTELKIGNDIYMVNNIN